MNELVFYNSKSNNPVFKSPLEFINTLDDTKKHIVIYYEKEIIGKYIKFKFLKNGLLNEETCIYCIYKKDNNKDIENEMINNGIDVDYFSKRGLLTIFRIPNLFEHPKGLLKGAQEILNEIFSNVNTKRPFRLVIRMIEYLDTKEKIEANLRLEQFCHSIFDRFNGKMLCYYNFDPYPMDINNKWTEIILQNHHSAIFIADDLEVGIAFDM